MRWDWSSLPSLTMPMEPIVYELVETIIDFNGPQLAIYRAHGTDWLGVVSDEEEHIERWIMTGLSKREYAALSRGDFRTLDVFKNKALRVSDLDWKTGQFVMEWSGVNYSSIDVRALPKASASLAMFMKPVPYEESTTERTVVFDRPGMSDHGVDFRTLSDVLSSLQKVWSAIGQAISEKPTSRGVLSQDIVNRSCLRTTSLRAGSIVVDIQTGEHEQFNQSIADTFVELIQARDDEDALGEVFHRLKNRTRTSYADFLKALGRGDMEFELNYQSSRAFVSPRLADCVREKLKAFIPDDHEIEEVEMVGFFSALNTNRGTFVFDSEPGEEVVQGDVSPRAELRLPVEVGRGALYKIKLQVSLVKLFQEEPRPRYVLIAAYPV